MLGVHFQNFGAVCHLLFFFVGSCFIYLFVNFYCQFRGFGEKKNKCEFNLSYLADVYSLILSAKFSYVSQSTPEYVLDLVSAQWKSKNYNIIQCFPDSRRKRQTLSLLCMKISESKRLYNTHLKFFTAFVVF